MDNVFKYFNGFFKGLTGLVMTILGLAIAVSFLMGSDGFFGYDVIAQITGIITVLPSPPRVRRPRRAVPLPVQLAVDGLDVLCSGFTGIFIFLTYF